MLSWVVSTDQEKPFITFSEMSAETLSFSLRRGDYVIVTQVAKYNSSWDVLPIDCGLNRNKTDLELRRLVTC